MFTIPKSFVFRDDSTDTQTENYALQLAFIRLVTSLDLTNSVIYIDEQGERVFLSDAERQIIESSLTEMSK